MKAYRRDSKEGKASRRDSKWGSRTSSQLGRETSLMQRVAMSHSGRGRPMQWPAMPSLQLERAPSLQLHASFEFRTPSTSTFPEKPRDDESLPTQQYGCVQLQAWV